MDAATMKSSERHTGEPGTLGLPFQFGMASPTNDHGHDWNARNCMRAMSESMIIPKVGLREIEIGRCRALHTGLEGLLEGESLQGAIWRAGRPLTMKEGT